MLKVFSAYSFNLYYMKGIDMKLSDFLSRIKVDRSNPCGIIPGKILYSHYILSA